MKTSFYINCIPFLLNCTPPRLSFFDVWIVLKLCVHPSEVRKLIPQIYRNGGAL